MGHYTFLHFKVIFKPGVLLKQCVKSFYQITFKRQRCPDVAFINSSNEYRLIAGKVPFHIHLRLE
jgi:hypothetical protein